MNLGKGNLDTLDIFRFRANWKGVYHIRFRINGEEKQVEIKSAYPGFLQRIQEAALLIRVSLKHTVNRVTKRSC